MSMTMRSVSLRDEVIGHERVTTKILHFGSGYPQRNKHSTSQEGLEDEFNLFGGSAMLLEGHLSGKKNNRWLILCKM